MRSTIFPGLILLMITMSSCDNKPIDTLERYKIEIIEAEADFTKMANEIGIAEAFLAFADENAVLRRGERLIKGKAAIKAYFEQQSESYKDMKLLWKPDFVDVSESGDLAYTYGGYTAKVTLADGSVNEGKGIFHTVWKRQEDGSWKYVWD